MTSTSCDLREINLPTGSEVLTFVWMIDITFARKSLLATRSPPTLTLPMTGIYADGWRSDTTTTHCYQVHCGLLSFNLNFDVLGVLTPQTILCIDLVDTLYFKGIRRQ